MPVPQRLEAWEHTGEVAALLDQTAILRHGASDWWKRLPAASPATQNTKCSNQLRSGSTKGAAVLPSHPAAATRTYGAPSICLSPATYSGRSAATGRGRGLTGRWPLYLAGGDFLFAHAVVFFQFGFLLAFSSGAGLVFLATSESARSSFLGLLPNPIQGDFSFDGALGAKKVFLTRYILVTYPQNNRSQKHQICAILYPSVAPIPAVRRLFFIGRPLRPSSVTAITPTASVCARRNVSDATTARWPRRHPSVPSTQRCWPARKRSSCVASIAARCDRSVAMLACHTAAHHSPRSRIQA